MYLSVADCCHRPSVKNFNFFTLLLVTVVASKLRMEESLWLPGVTRSNARKIAGGYRS
jgi:hypothetical protein